jgi:hypothetical protein
MKLVWIWGGNRSRDIAVGIAMATVGWPRDWSKSPGRVKNFLFSTSFRRTLGPTQPLIQWVSGALSPGVRRPQREAHHSPPFSADVKKIWIYTSTPHTSSWFSA